MKVLLYNVFNIYIKSVFFFYCKKIKIEGIENIPKKGAVLLTANHPNGLLDPILIASSIQRKTHFLVKADIFKNPKIATIFDWLGMMPIYRIRDGIRSVTKNNLIFEKCRNLLKDKKVLLIFPEGSHAKKRTIRPLSKGFTRIVFGTLDEQPTLNVHIVPIGITYQDSSKYPSAIALKIGKPILVNDFYNSNQKNESVKKLKQKVTHQLKKLTVHIDNNEEFEIINNKLNNTVKNFIEVDSVNQIIKTKTYPKPLKKQNSFSFLKLLIIINSCIPYFIWKILTKKITEIEFIDTFRYTVNSITFSLFYCLQSVIISYLFNWKVGILYFTSSLLLVLLYTKTSSN